jgi:hypothetical protein
VNAQNQSVVNVEDPADHRITGIRATGTITGRDSQSILGVGGPAMDIARLVEMSSGSDREAAESRRRSAGGSAICGPGKHPRNRETPELARCSTVV